MSEKYFAQPSTPSAQKHFAQLPAVDTPRSKFDRSHGYKTTFDAGQLIPTFLDEVLPGDTFDLKSTAFARMATPLKPIFDNCYLDTHYFFVPNRLVWDNWQEFCGERRNTTDDPSDLTIPQTQIALDMPSNRIAAYFGIPANGPATTIDVSALPFRAYQLIFNEWYRDQNLVSEIAINTGDTSGSYTSLVPYRRSKMHDYFTSALPWPQKSDSPVFIPLGTTAPVITDGNSINIRAGLSGSDRNMIMGNTANSSGQGGLGYGGALIATSTSAFLGAASGMLADLTSATAVSVNDLRTAFQVQKLLERDARGGTRYIEIVLSHFGVHSDDARLQRPEYLGGSHTMVNINPIASTVPTEDTAQANLAAYGTALGRGGFTKSFTEHGHILGITSVRTNLTYQNGIERFWSRQTRYDFYWPSLAHLGEQPILNKEIYVQGTATDNLTWGYQERYAEYRYKPSRITGKFQSSDPQSLDVWHLSQDFDELPPLNLLFVAEGAPFDRILAVPSEPDFLLDMWFDLKCERAMPVYSVPGLIDHF